jgi:2-polyprenyl-3-methyl-5-hydroxy-6-metoxy-1,4-benzoquinol methylase
MDLNANLNASRYDYALQVAKRFQASLPSTVVFDIGAGEGRVKEAIEAIGYRWYGFDKHPRGLSRHWDLTLGCPDHELKAGLVLWLDVIEHLVNPGLALSHIRQVLMPNGMLVLTTPNPRWSFSRIHALLHGNPACFTQSDLDLNGHVFPVWPHVLKKMLNDEGFEVIEYVTLDSEAGWPGCSVSIRYPLRLLHALASIAIERFDRSACGMTYGIVAQPQSAG